MKGTVSTDGKGVFSTHFMTLSVDKKVVLVPKLTDNKKVKLKNNRDSESNLSPDWLSHSFFPHLHSNLKMWVLSLKH